MRPRKQQLFLVGLGDQIRHAVADTIAPVASSVLLSVGQRLTRSSLASCTREGGMFEHEALLGVKRDQLGGGEPDQPSPVVRVVVGILRQSEPIEQLRACARLVELGAADAGLELLGRVEDRRGVHVILHAPFPF